MEFHWAIVALVGVMLLGTLEGILVAILASLVSLAEQSANPPVYVLGRKPGTNVFRPRTELHPEDESFPGLLIVRIEGRVFFANAARIGDRIRRLVAETSPTTVAIDLGSVIDLEYTALKALTEAEQRFRLDGISIWLVDLNPAVLDLVQRSPLGATLGRERMHFNLEIAVRRYLESMAASSPNEGRTGDPSLRSG
jgi:MFS superfamily sulfate permease-like transporter